MKLYLSFIEFINPYFGITQTPYRTIVTTHTVTIKLLVCTLFCCLYFVEIEANTLETTSNFGLALIEELEIESGILSGDAIDAGNCSVSASGTVVNLKSGASTFNNVNMANAASYTLTIYSIHPGDRNLTVNVNGVDYFVDLNPSTGFCYEGGGSSTTDLVVPLIQGDNIFIFSSTTSTSACIIDRVGIYGDESLLRDAASFYFSDSTGDDTNNGSETFPFKTIAKLNSLNLVPGDQLFFKKGDTFIGQILVDRSGSDGSPIVYNSYGTGDLPILSGSDGNNGIADPLSTIDIIDRSYLEFKNLHIQNERFDTAVGADDDKSFGIFVHSTKALPVSGNFEDATLSTHLRFENLYLDNIYAVSLDGVEFNAIRTTGIYLEDAFVNDLIIENSYFTNIQRSGVWLRKYISDAIIRNNEFITIGGSGTIISKSNRVLYENNIMRFNGSSAEERMVGRGSGMWVFASNDVVAQYNTSQHARGPNDSSGMHVDYGNSNILFQYNYLEDSSGGFCETLGTNNNIIWRFNISVNEGDRSTGKNRLIWLSNYAYVPAKSDNIYIYNNTIYSGIDYKNNPEDSEIKMQVNDLYFYNNLISLSPTAKMGVLSYTNQISLPSFAKNLMYGGTINTSFKALDATIIEQNPLLYSPGTNNETGYALLTGSPAIGAAHTFTEPTFPLAGIGIFANITSNATKDFYGNSVNLTSTTNIGAFNGTALNSTPTVSTYEAEDAIIANGANEINCVNASGAKAVNAQNTGETITFSNINVTQTGLYLIKIFYASPSFSEVKININSEGQETISLPASDAYCYQSGTPTSFHIVRELNSGSNTLEIEEGIIDKIEVISVDDLTLDTAENTLTNTAAFLNKTIISNGDYLELIIQKVETLSNQCNISIYDISGKLLFNKKLNTNELIVPIYNFSSGLKIFVATIEDKTVVRKFIVR